jgi:phosphoadenosine phosphosulfate reductase
MPASVSPLPLSYRSATAQAELARSISAAFSAIDLFERLAVVRRSLPGRIVFTTSFGIEDQAIAHAMFAQNLAIDVMTLDTGRLFAETYRVWSETERRYGRRIAAFYPDRRGIERWVARNGIDGFRDSVEARQGCCFVRKIEPLARALEGATGWIAGLRADQSAERSNSAFAAADAGRGLIKVNPLLDWPRERVAGFVREHGVPANPLHDRGYLSIGCAPCTRAVAPGEPERAGRWWWEQDAKKECGLHNRPRPADAPDSTHPRREG